MADDADNLGDLQVNITGDFSELQDAIDQSVSVATEGADQIASSFQAIADASGLAGRDLEIFEGIVTDLESQGQTLTEALQGIADSAGSVGDVIAGGAADALAQLQDAEQGAGDAAETTTGSLNDEADAAGNVGEAANEAEGGLAEMAEQLIAVGEALAVTEAMGEFVQEAIEVYGQTQQVVTSFELLGQSSEEAEETISGLSDMSLELAVPFGTLEQSARSLAVSLQGVQDVDINDVLEAAANSAALTGRSFDMVTTALQRVEVTGAVTSRQLLQLGITWQQLADSMGTSVENAQALLKKGGQDATQDLETVVSAINSISQGAAQAQAQTVLGQITILKNQVELLFDAIGQDIAPVVSTILAGLTSVVQVARDAAVAFQALPQPVKDIAVALALAAAAAVPLTAAVGAFGLALAGVNTLVPSFVELMGALAIATEAQATAETEAALATEALGAAALEATPAIEGLAAAEGEATLAASGSAAELGALGVAAEEVGTTAVEAGAGVETAGAAISGLVPIVGLALIGIAAMITGIRDTVTNAQALGSAFSQVSSGLNELGGPINLIKSGLSSMGADAESAEGGILNLSDVASGLNDKLLEVETTMISGVWSAFANQMTFQLPLAFQTATLAVTAFGRELGLLPTAEVEAEMQALQEAVSQMTIHMSGLTSGTQAVVTSQANLANAVTAAKQSVQELTAMQQAGISVLSNGVSVVNALAAAHVALTTATNAQLKSWGDAATAAKSLSDSIGALTTQFNNDQGAADRAYDTYQQVLQAFESGQTSLNGLAINLQTVTTAWNNLVAAEQKASGVTQAWVDSQSNVAAAVNAEANQLQTLDNAATKTSAVLAAMQTSFNTGVVIPGTSTVATLQMVQQAFLANQKAIDAYNKSLDTSAFSMADVTGAQQTLNTVMVNGQAVAVSVGDAIGDFAIATTAAKVGLDADTDAVNANAAAQAAILPTVIGVTAATNNATTAKHGHTSASQDLTTQLQKENQAWAQGSIVIQQQGSDMAYIENVMGGTSAATAELDKQVSQMASDMQSAGEVTNEEADALLALASAADDAADAVENLNNQTSKSGKGGAGSGGLSDYLGSAIALAQSASTGGALGGGGVNQSQIDAMAQELADATGQVVTTLDGVFIPAVTQAANLTAAQANLAANATSANTTATTTNTTATTASTAATVAATVALTSAQATFVNAAAAGDNIVTAFASLPPTIQDYLNSVNGTLVAYDDTTGALQYTVTAADGLTETMNAAVAANELATSATSDLATAAGTATTALSNLSTTTSTAMTPYQQQQADQQAFNQELANSVTQLGALAYGAQTSASSMTSLGQILAQATQHGVFASSYGGGGGTPVSGGTSNSGITSSNTPVSNSPFGTTYPGGTPIEGGTSNTPYGQYVNPNPDLMTGQVPQYTPTGGGPTINVTVTGNSVTSAALVNQLANQVAQVINTNLRTNAGLKN